MKFRRKKITTKLITAQKLSNGVFKYDLDALSHDELICITVDSIALTASRMSKSIPEVFAMHLEVYENTLRERLSKIESPPKF